MSVSNNHETEMNDLNEEIKTTIAELKYLEMFAKELEMTRAAEIVNKQIKKIEKLKKNRNFS